MLAEQRQEHLLLSSHVKAALQVLKSAGNCGEGSEGRGRLEGWGAQLAGGGRR